MSQEEKKIEVWVNKKDDPESKLKDELLKKKYPWASGKS